MSMIADIATAVKKNDLASLAMAQTLSPHEHACVPQRLCGSAQLMAAPLPTLLRRERAHTARFAVRPFVFLVRRASVSQLLGRPRCRWRKCSARLDRHFKIVRAGRADNSLTKTFVSNCLPREARQASARQRSALPSDPDVVFSGRSSKFAMSAILLVAAPRNLVAAPQADGFGQKFGGERCPHDHYGQL